MIERTDSGAARSERAQGPALGAPAPEGVPSDLGYLELRRRTCASSRLQRCRETATAAKLGQSESADIDVPSGTRMRRR